MQVAHQLVLADIGHQALIRPDAYIALVTYESSDATDLVIVIHIPMPSLPLLVGIVAHRIIGFTQGAFIALSRKHLIILLNSQSVHMLETVAARLFWRLRIYLLPLRRICLRSLPEFLAPGVPITNRRFVALLARVAMVASRFVTEPKLRYRQVLKALCAYLVHDSLRH